MALGHPRGYNTLERVRILMSHAASHGAPVQVNAKLRAKNIACRPKPAAGTCRVSGHQAEILAVVDLVC